MRARHWYWLVAILVVAAALRVVYLQEVREAPDFSAPEVDAGYHDYWARGLAFGEWGLPEVKADPQIRTSPYFRPPGYPYFLAGVYKLMGPGYVGPRVAQALVGLLCVLTGFFAIRRWLGPPVALIASAMIATSWILIYYEGEFLETPLMVLGILGLAHLLLGWRREVTVLASVGAGTVCGLSALVRPNALIFLPAIALWAWWLSRRRGDRRYLRVGLVGVVLGTATVILPTTVRNYAVSGQLVAITSNVGINLYMGNNEIADGRCPSEIPELGQFKTCYDYPPLRAKLESRLGRKLSESDVSNYFTRLALEYMRDHPAGVLELLGRKTLLFWGPLEVSHNKVEEAEREHSPLLRRLPLRFSWVLALAMLGGGWLWIASRRRRQASDTVAEGAPIESQHEGTVLVLLLIGAWWLSFLPFFVAARYRAPIVPLLIGFGAYALYRLWLTVRERRRRSTALAIGVGVALFLLVNVNWIGYRVDVARWHYARGRGYSASDRMDLAIEEFRRALAINPDFSSAHVDLGVALAMRQEWEESYQHLSRAAQLAPDNPFAQQNFGGILEVQGHLEEARDHFQAANRLMPSWSKPRDGLARVQRALEARTTNTP